MARCNSRCSHLSLITLAPKPKPRHVVCHVAVLSCCERLCCLISYQDWVGWLQLVINALTSLLSSLGGASLIWLWLWLWLSHLTVTHSLSFCYQQHFLSLPPHLIELGNNLCNSQIHNCPQIIFILGHFLCLKLTELKVFTAVSDSCCPQLWAVTAVSNITSMWTV